MRASDSPVLGDEAQHADAVIPVVPAAREVLGVHLEDARHEDAAGGVVDAAVPFVGEELLGRGAQRRLRPSPTYADGAAPGIRSSRS
jgi:hypothetical protein